MNPSAQEFVYPADTEYPLNITAKRYLPRSETYARDPDAITLICTHSTSFHKEIWEPVLENLWNTKGLKIREAWAIDCPNHGASALLNEEILRTKLYGSIIGCQEYGRACHRFLTAGPRKGAKVDFASRRLVGLGHSLGGTAMTVLQEIRPLIHFETVILVEPMISPGGAEPLIPLGQQLLKGAYERRDVWPDRETAFKSLKGSTKWDPRIVDLFVKYGLRDHPGMKFQRVPYKAVSLCCTREYEASMYRDFDGCEQPAKDLTNVCSRMPTHMIFGAIPEFPRAVHKQITDPRSGRRFASITRIDGVGHFIVQEKPDELSAVIINILKAHQSTSIIYMPSSRL